MMRGSPDFQALKLDVKQRLFPQQSKRLPIISILASRVIVKFLSDMIRILLIEIWAYLILSFVMQVYFSYQDIVISNETAVLEQKISELNIENKMLELEVSDATSMKTIEENARKEGYTDIRPGQRVYIKDY